MAIRFYNTLTRTKEDFEPMIHAAINQLKRDRGAISDGAAA